MMSLEAVGHGAAGNSRMPRDSNWNTATVSPRANGPVTGGVVQRQRGEVNAAASSRRARHVDRLHRPVDDGERAQARKSNFTGPTASTSSLSNCVTTRPPPASQYNGAKSVSGEGAITTPPACLPALRVRSSARARVDQGLTSSSCSSGRSGRAKPVRSSRASWPDPFLRRGDPVRRRADAQCCWGSAWRCRRQEP